MSTPKSPRKRVRATLERSPRTVKAKTPAAGAAKEKPLDWPPNLNSEKADALFAKLEEGVPKSKAPAMVGLAWRTVFRWMKLHKDFAERVEEAAQIGYQAVVDTFPEIAESARDKESALAAKARVDILDRYLQRTAPHRYNVRLLQHSIGAPADKGGAGSTPAVGLVLVPVKASGRGLPPSPPIEGVATRIVVPDKHTAEDAVPTP